MIYTVTFNPALDYIMQLPQLKQGAVNRCRSVRLRYGGKGVNVAVMLHRLGVPVTALGFAAGFTGQELERGLKEMGVQTGFVHLRRGLTRINVKLSAGQETELNAPGPQIDSDELETLLQRIDVLPEGSVLVLAGSVPADLPQDMYASILRRISERQLLTVVDASGPLLTSVAACRPFLVKPNREELGEIFGRLPRTDEEVLEAARSLQKMGACNVLVSLGGDGALLLQQNGAVERVAAPSGEVADSVGAGDSMVAGFLAGWLKTGRMRPALVLGVAAGSATAFSPELAGEKQVLALYEQLQEKISP